MSKQECIDISDMVLLLKMKEKKQTMLSPEEAYFIIKEALQKTNRRPTVHVADAI